MFGILVILFTVTPALEFYLLFKVGSNIGALNTLVLIVLTGIVGAALAKREGLSTLYKIQEQTAQGMLPGKEIVHGFLIFGGGLLLLTPGFLTDILGLSMVLPGPRHFLVHLAQRWIEKAIASGNVQVFTSTNFRRRTYEDPDVIEVDFKESDRD